MIMNSPPFFSPPLPNSEKVIAKATPYLYSLFQDPFTLKYRCTLSTGGGRRGNGTSAVPPLRVPPSPHSCARFGLFNTPSILPLRPSPS